MDEEQAVATEHRVAVLGLGGGGGRIAAALRRLQGPSAFSIAAADTDAGALRLLPDLTALTLGQEWTRQDGCGGDSVLGERAASASTEELSGFMRGARLLVVLAGLGGGTGAGAAKVVARLARDTETTPLFLLTLPFAFEGNWRQREAEKALAPLRKLAGAVIVVPNDLLFTALPADTPAAEAFRMTDNLLAEAVSGLARTASANALVPADFARVRSVLRHRHATCAVGVGRTEDGADWQTAIDAFLSCPMVGGRDALSKADAAVVTLLGGHGLGVGEVNACLTAVQQHFPPEARLVIGAYTDERLGHGLQITGLVCKYEGTAPRTSSADTEEPAKPARKRRSQKKTESLPVQGELPLQEQTLGAFSGVPPTNIDGHNIDIPTFQRRGVILDTGE